METGRRRIYGLGSHVRQPRLRQVRHAYGAKGRRVESAEALAPTLEDAFREGGVQLVIVPVDYSENSRVLVDELKNRVKEVAQ